MDPISIIVEIEIATMLLAGVGAFATWLHHKNKKREHRQRELQHQEMKALHHRHHTERMETEKAKTKKRDKMAKRAKTSLSQVDPPEKIVAHVDQT